MIQNRKHEEHDEGEDQHAARKDMRFVILHRFHKGVNLGRHNLGFPRHIAADHQYDTELTDSVREGENNTGKESRFAERNNDSEERADRIHPISCGLIR